MEVREIDGYTPNWSAKCRNCSATPTVAAVRNDVVVLQTGLCGPCCWGEADAIDPENWNR